MGLSYGQREHRKALALNAVLLQTPHLQREDIHPIWEKSLSLKICRMDLSVRLAGTGATARSAGTRFSLGAPHPCVHTRTLALPWGKARSSDSAPGIWRKPAGAWKALVQL